MRLTSGIAGGADRMVRRKAGRLGQCSGMTPEQGELGSAISCAVRTFETPEEAARGELPEEYVRVVGVAVRNEAAVVAQVMNADGYPHAYEVETVECFREGDGWVGGNSGNNNLVWMPTIAGRGTVVWWGEAPAGVTAGRIRLGDQEQTVGVEDGFVFVVFDNVPEQELRPYAPLREQLAGLPKVVEWTSG